jgi:hypothetical protein
MITFRQGQGVSAASDNLVTPSRCREALPSRRAGTPAHSAESGQPTDKHATDPSADVNGFEVFRNRHARLRRRGFHLGHERLEPLDRGRLAHIVRDVEPVPMGR